MLAPHISSKYLRSVVAPYKIVHKELRNINITNNSDFNTKEEIRLQDMFGEEIRKKLKRAGVDNNFFKGKRVLEVCAGSGFLTYHLLSNYKIEHLTVNDISINEINSAKLLLGKSFPDANLDWIIGDLHEISISNKFDLIIGNSFLHHFHDMPKVLEKFHSLLNKGGIFISMHEPTVNSLAIVAVKPIAYLLSLIYPKMIIEYSRRLHSKNKNKNKNLKFYTDIWLLESSLIKKTAFKLKYKDAKTISWDLIFKIITNIFKLHITPEKRTFNNKEKIIRRYAFKIDSILNKFLPPRFFGSLAIILYR